MIQLVDIVRIFFATLSIIAGALKVKDLKGFYIITLSYGILPKKLAKLGAYTLPFLEIIIGIVLLTDQIHDLPGIYAPGINMLLHLAYSVFTTTAYIRKTKLENCGCFGAEFSTKLTKKYIAWDFLLLLLSVWLFVKTIEWLH